MYNLEIRSCTSPHLLAPRFKIFIVEFSTSPGFEPGPAEPEADMLLSEPTLQLYCIYAGGHALSL